MLLRATDLKVLCKKHSLPQSGNKQALIDRLAHAGVVLADLEKRSLEDGDGNPVSNEISKAAPEVLGHGSDGSTGNGTTEGEGKAVAPATNKDHPDTLVFDENGKALAWPGDDESQWKIDGWRTLLSGDLQFKAINPCLEDDKGVFVPNGTWGAPEAIFKDNPKIVVDFVVNNKELAQVIFNTLSKVAKFCRGAKYKSPMLHLKRLSDDYKAKHHGPSVQDSNSAHSVTITNATPASKGGETLADDFPVVVSC